jgi:hypothetical protein
MSSRLKTCLDWLLAAFCLFAVSSLGSYFLRSTGYGLFQVNDGLLQVGFPFLMFDRGGFEGRELFSASAALGNLLVASVAGVAQQLRFHLAPLRKCSQVQK